MATMEKKQMEAILGREVSGSEYDILMGAFEVLGLDIEKNFKDYADFQFCKLLNKVIAKAYVLNQAMQSYEQMVEGLLSITEQMRAEKLTKRAGCDIEREVIRAIGRNKFLETKIRRKHTLTYSDSMYLIDVLKELTTDTFE